ncbi:nitroreductase family protein [Armatimonas sp.]|uniref:nitroreductase family protein n=1 Tax=Armatimonas sp. TaxID=1872638 RepID=UPI00286A4002|nr:nitroreductase family protein [Armatimonas sp.]
MEKPTLNDHPILEPLRQRWSPLAFDPKPVPAETLLSLFEAARWSSSCFGEQPWRFIVGVKATDPTTFEKLASTLVPGNSWAIKAPVLILGVAKKTFAYNGSENRFASYDVGQAVGQLTVQAASADLYLHQMGGFDAVKAQEIFAIPDDFAPQAMIALGYLGAAELLDEEKQQARHNSPTRARKPLSELVFSEWEKPAF